MSFSMLEYIVQAPDSKIICLFPYTVSEIKLAKVLCGEVLIHLHKYLQISAKHLGFTS